MSSENELNAIRDQVSFYFSDSNWWRDVFLRNTAEQNDGWVPLVVLLTFNRLKELTTDPEVVLSALADHPDITISEDRAKLRRTSLPQTKPNFDERTVRAKQFGKGATNDAVRKLFSSFGKVTWSQLPIKKPTGQIFGFALVEFASREAAEKAVAASGTVKVSGELSPNEDGSEAEITVKLLETHRAEHPEHYSQSKKRAKPSSDTQESRETEETKEAKKKQLHFTPDLIVHYKFEEDSTPVDQPYIRTIFAAFGAGPAFVQLTEGNESHEGHVRMKIAEDARAAVAALNENPALTNDRKGTFAIIQGEAEEAYWENIFKSSRANNNNRGRRNQRGGRGGRGGREKRQRT